MRKHLLILAIGFLPNIGGLETHLKDLIEELIKREWKVKVLTYQPLNTPILGKWIEKGKNLIIFRLPVFRGLFYKLLRNPFFEFLYLGPLLFLVTPLILLRYSDINTINAQGIIAGFSAAFWAKIFKKKYVISVQSVYHFPKKGLYRKVCEWIFRSADKVIAISSQAKDDVKSLGIKDNKIIIYTNWENEKNFKVISKSKARDKIGFKDKFIVSFFGRLVEEKGIRVFLDAISLSSSEIAFLIYGEGPLKEEVENSVDKYKNAYYMGVISPQELGLHYSAADLVVMPTLNEEGFGRVASGALLCGTPVIASDRGALPEVVNTSVGEVVNPTSGNIAKAINFLFSHQEQLQKKASKCRSYALSKFSAKNVEAIIKSYL